MDHHRCFRSRISVGRIRIPFVGTFNPSGGIRDTAPYCLKQDIMGCTTRSRSICCRQCRRRISDILRGRAVPTRCEYRDPCSRLRKRLHCIPTETRCTLYSTLSCILPRSDANYIQIASMDTGFGFTASDAVYHYHSIYDSQRWQELYADPGFYRHVGDHAH